MCGFYWATLYIAVHAKPISEPQDFVGDPALAKYSSILQTAAVCNSWQNLGEILQEHNTTAQKQSWSELTLELNSEWLPTLF